MRRVLSGCLLSALLLALISCGGEQSTAGEGAYRLYYLSRATSGSALAWEPWSPEENREVAPEELLEVLLQGPQDEDLQSPFPRGTALVSCSWDGENQGNLLIRLSEQYGGLSDVSLTLADYAIALTLGQLEGVTSVQISATGLSGASRSHQMLIPGEAELEDIPGTTQQR